VIGGTLSVAGGTSTVLKSAGLTAAYNALVPEFERATGHKARSASSRSAS
jgi:ABC-type molybdate transport system substrate-binding protein